ncbi:MAG TPA: hypothetical protein VGM56_28345 [Byssovorax sp.]|jgi:hydrogenase maturation protease
MSDAASALARAVLYEGYVLYPYRASSLKNRAPCLLGALVPDAASAGETRAFFEVVALAAAEGDARVTATARFLHVALVERADAPRWHDADERAITLDLGALEDLARGSTSVDFAFDGADGVAEGATRRGARVEGRLTARAERLDTELYRVVVRLENRTAVSTGADATAVACGALAAAHALLSIEGGVWISSIDPPDDVREASAARASVGVFPVLLGDPGERALLFASPFALGDHPCIAPESPGDFHDGAEIDEMLALRVRTMTAAEIAEARALDPRSRAVIDRTLALDDAALARLHAGRFPAALAAPKAERARTGGRVLGAGDRVRLCPKRRADVFDLALAGRVATIASVEQDVDGRAFFTVTVDDDPGRDLGAAGLPGHRFFFRVDEVEPA